MEAMKTITTNRVNLIEKGQLSNTSTKNSVLKKQLDAKKIAKRHATNAKG